MVDFFKFNYQWVFSGIGVAVIGLLVGGVLRERNRKRRAGRSGVGSVSSTQGNRSPIVYGSKNVITQNNDATDHETQS